MIWRKFLSVIAVYSTFQHWLCIVSQKFREINWCIFRKLLRKFFSSNQFTVKFNVNLTKILQKNCVAVKFRHFHCLKSGQKTKSAVTWKISREINLQYYIHLLFSRNLLENLGKVEKKSSSSCYFFCEINFTNKSMPNNLVFFSWNQFTLSFLDKLRWFHEMFAKKQKYFIEDNFFHDFLQKFVKLTVLLKIDLSKLIPRIILISCFSIKKKHFL